MIFPFAQHFLQTISWLLRTKLVHIWPRLRMHRNFEENRLTRLVSLMRARSAYIKLCNQTFPNSTGKLLKHAIRLTNKPKLSPHELPSAQIWWMNLQENIETNWISSTLSWSNRKLAQVVAIAKVHKGGHRYAWSCTNTRKPCTIYIYIYNSIRNIPTNQR